MKFVSSVVVAFILAASSLTGAAPIGPQEIMRMSAQGFSLLRLDPDVDPVWKTEEEKWALKKAGTNFMDVSETWLDMQPSPAFEKASSLREEVSITATCTLYNEIDCIVNSRSHIT